eukprot:jgi/Chrpa1/21060/Chrysochromulina_OHIO_Genome00022796-RA
MVASDGFAAVERRTKGIASRSEKRRAPRDHARELALPKDMRNSLSPLATGAALFGKHRSKRVCSISVSEDATTQEPHSIISGCQHGGALLVVELGDP